MEDARPALEDQAERQRKLLGAYREVFDAPAGRIVLLDLMRAGGVLSVSLGQTPQETAWNDGRRSLVLHVLQQLRMQEAEMLRLATQKEPSAFDQVAPADDIFAGEVG